MNKVYGTAAEALDGILHDGMLIAAGGFGLGGIPELLLAAMCGKICMKCFIFSCAHVMLKKDRKEMSRTLKMPAGIPSSIIFSRHDCSFVRSCLRSSARVVV